MKERRFTGFAAVTAGLALVAVTTAAGHQQAAQVVTIQYSAETGVVSASPDTVTVRQGQRLEWVSSRQWRVNVPLGASVFGPPPGKGPGTARSFNGGANQRAGAPVLPDAATGGYKYDVSVFDGGEWHTRDPEIVVIPRDRGGS